MDYNRRLGREEQSGLEQVKQGLSSAKKYVKAGLVGVLALWGAYDSWFLVPSDSKGLVKTFGAYSWTSGPGLNFKAPRPIQSVIKEQTENVRRLEFGFRTLKSGVTSQFMDTQNATGEDLKNLQAEALMLTGDLNVVDLEFLVQYKVRDPYAWNFNLKDPEKTLRDVSQSVMIELVGDQSFDEALSIMRNENTIAAKARIQKYMDQYKSGAEVVSIYMQSTNPPKEVRSAFNRVNQAMQNKDKKVNEAMKAYNQEVTEAGGKAREMVQVAEGEATRRVNEAEGEANKFDQVMAAYGRNPEITQQRLYFESMQRVLSRIKDKWVVDKEVSQGSGVNGLLHYNKPLVGGSK